MDLSALEQALSPVLGGTSLGFASVPLLAVGNEELDVEEITSFEAGYSVVVRNRTFVQATYYRNHVNTFTSGLLPQVGTSLGRLNPAFGPYQPPASLSPTAAAIVTTALAQTLPPPLFATMSNRDDGSPVFAVLSLANFGEADTQGIELSATTQINGWRFDASYGWFDFTIKSEAPDVPLAPTLRRIRARSARRMSRRNSTSARACGWSTVSTGSQVSTPVRFPATASWIYRRTTR